MRSESPRVAGKRPRAWATVMTKKNDSAKQNAGKAADHPLTQWAVRVFHSRSVVTLAEHERLQDRDGAALESVERLAALVLDPSNEAASKIDRVLAILRLRDRDVMVAQAVKIIQTHAGDPEKIVEALWKEAHPGFHKLTLKTKLEKVTQLLKDYKPGRGRRTSDGQGAGKLSEAGILDGLNTLALYPLGSEVNAHSLGQAAIRGKRKIT